ncbi:hypothetical protein [Nocardia sp. CA-120079]|uniref:hypothetical protein n=1 Tax=Nocardia sp. CA-120079 TaxID=3239974 RepID=UPI003D98205F
MRRQCGAAGELPPVEVGRFVPFAPVSKRTEVTVRDTEGHRFWVSKGAPQVMVIAALSGDNPHDRD